ncbi:hypothetical protein mRhiFer1_008982 [Rhinolophus ferrumequinum]|uniref:Uncharacterized protein n=1 Tax=Rhinolophus ferrumequinum TaxID=59479 RepID=A0A7J7TET4_RHIFE|nr:hypothetical protein mRhiFer1_008982 [Rhinolophus ferrumequinum]
MSYQFRDKLHKFSFCFKETYLLQQGSQRDLSISNLLKVMCVQIHLSTFTGHAERPVDELFLDSCSSFPANSCISFLIAAVTNDYTLDGLKQNRFIILQFGRVGMRPLFCLPRSLQFSLTFQISTLVFKRVR